MRNFIFILACLLSGCVTENINTVLSTHELHEIRLRQLDDFCAKINEEILALQLIVEAGGVDPDYITDIQETTAGYRITFNKGGTITVYHGEKGEQGNKGEAGKDGADGKDGLNGSDGKDGLNAPIIGVQKDIDGKYYWTTTLNDITDWLKGENGEKLAVTGERGDSGEAGTPGKDGSNAPLPKLGVDADGYWTINDVRLLCNGLPVPATGPQGPQGKPGKDQIETGQSGDLLIKEIIPYTDSVIFILTHDNSRFAVPRETPTEIRISSVTKGTFYYGQTLPVNFTCQGITEVTAIVPPGWKAITDFPSRTVIVSAPADDDLYGDREGELTLIGGNSHGKSIIASLKIIAIRAYKVTDWNFNTSRVYHILNPQGIKVAEICREYIHGYSESQQAIVIYPYDTYTRSYGKGFVVNGAGEVNHDGSQYTGSGSEGTNYTTVYITVNGISTQQPLEFTPTSQEAYCLADGDGNIYPITKIGKQYWTTVNWNATHYMDGSPITLENDIKKWTTKDETGEAHYCYPANNPHFQAVYGLIYNMAAVKTGKLFPEGWDIPSCDLISGDNDCQDMLDYLGENNNIKLRSSLWGNDPAKGEWLPTNNHQGNNLSGFNAFPGGYLVEGDYRSLGEFGVFWTSSLLWKDGHYASYHYKVLNLRNYMPTVGIDGLELSGYWGASIRLIKKD